MLETYAINQTSYYPHINQSGYDLQSAPSAPSNIIDTDIEKNSNSISDGHNSPTEIKLETEKGETY